MGERSETLQDGAPPGLHAAARAHVYALLTQLPDVMLTTFVRTGEQPVARARPMHVTRLEWDASMWFMASLSAGVAEHARAYPEAIVVGQAGPRCLSLTGTIEIVTARERVRAMWTRAHEVWFPEGPGDPDVGLLHFIPREAAYWDLSATRGLRFLIEAAKTYLTGRPPSHDAQHHGEVLLVPRP